MTKRASRTLILATAATVFVAVPGTAQSPGEANGAAEKNQVDEIIVTAQRSNQNLQDVPIAVTVVSADDLASRRLNDLAQLTLAAPSLSTGGDNSFSIRGVGSMVFNPNIDSSVGVSVDEVSLGVPLFMSNGILDDVARVEVLQGPQGLLFGRNASAGLLNIVSNRPNLSRTEGNLGLEANYRDKVPGDGSGIIVKGTVNLPLSETLGLRFNALHSNQSPIADMVAGSPQRFDANQERTAIKGKLLFEPSANASFYLIGDYSRERGVGGVFDRTYRSVAATGSSIRPALETRDRVTAGPGNLQYGSDADGYRSVDTYGVSLNSTFVLSDALTLNNIAAWRAFDLSLSIDSDGTSANLLNINRNDSSYNQYSNELRLAIAPGGAIEGQVGVYGFFSELDTATVLQGSAGSGVANALGRDATYRQTLRSLAAFGQFQLHLTDTLQLIAGGRVTNDHITINTRQNDRAYGTTLGPRTPPARQTFETTNFSWKLGAQYELTPDVTGYVTYSRGYKGPSFNPTFAVANQNLAILPETVGDIELGIKSTLFDRRLRLNLSMFREDFKNFQVQALNIGTGVTAVGNAGKVRAQGIEATAVIKPGAGLTINAGATWLDSKFRSYVGAACYLGQPNCGTNGTFDAAGLRTPASARFTSTIQAIYEFPETGGAVPFIEGSFNHRSAVNFSANNSPFTALGATDVFGASIGVRLASGFELSLFCKNCTNELVPTAIFYDNVDQVLRRATSIQQQWGYNSVRTIGVSAAARF
jgi:iron complex outermembrane receptor protein